MPLAFAILHLLELLEDEENEEEIKRLHRRNVHKVQKIRLKINNNCKVQVNNINKKYKEQHKYLFKSMTTEELNESALGTQEYWDSRYKTEVDNFKTHGDAGDVWFGTTCMNRICRWMLKSPLITKDKRIIDLGCGNGLFLVELSKKDFVNLLGVDYSQDAIVLANSVAAKNNLDIAYKVFDILSGDFQCKFDVVHDKGTYDAISLTTHARINRKTYIDKVHLMLESNGLFIITSCNWTQSELETHFSNLFKIIDVIPTPIFTFGGKTGKTVTTLVLQKFL